MKKKKYVADELDAAQTRFTPNSKRESSNAAPTGREHEDLGYTCILISEQFILQYTGKNLTGLEQLIINPNV
jgi:hypothetical protein